MPLGRQDIDLKASIQRVARGGLPIRASLRLKEEAGKDHKLFSSDLSVNEFLLAREGRCEIVSQVMGSSIYHIGRIPDYKGSQGGSNTYEIPLLSRAHREARQAAFHRLQLEAEAVQADAVIGVELGERLITMGAHGKGGDDGDEVIEFTAVGTAVRIPHIRLGEGPVLTDLSGQDFWALIREGWVPCGIAFEFCRWHVWHVLQNWGSGEVTLASGAIDHARKLVESRVQQQAVAMGAELVVGADLKVRVEEVDCGYPECEMNDLDVDVSWFGTGLRRMPEAAVQEHPPLPPLVLGMMPLRGRRRGDAIDARDDSDALRRAGKAVEEAAGNE